MLTEIINQHLKLSVRIDVLDRSYINGDLINVFHYGYKDDPVINQNYVEYEFNLTWNNFIVHSFSHANKRNIYDLYLRNQKQVFLTAINNYLNLDIPIQEKFNTFLFLRSELESTLKRIRLINYTHLGLVYDFLSIDLDDDLNVSSKKISIYHVKDIIHSFLVLHKPFLLDLCFFLDSYLEILKGNINLSQKDVLQNIRSVKAKKELSSLELINEVYFDSGAFKNFKESLVEQNLIKQISLIEFKKIFTNSTITTKANWIPDQNSLYYFIKLLRQLHKIEKRSPCWPIVARCFQWQDKELSPGVAHSHVPKDEVVKNKIKKCIDFLK